jgi:formamidopyrimidine-DNA glycosylase
MVEIPESKVISNQAGKTLTGKKIAEVFTATHKHKFAFFNGDPSGYEKLLKGRQVESTKGHGMFVDIHFDEHVCLTLSEGTNVRYYTASEPPPEKYQLLIVFDDGSFLVFNVAMYGGIWAFKGIFDNPYYQGSLNSISPLKDEFDELYFDNIFYNAPEKTSMKALLATKQRIPGLGNGVLHDILFNAGLHPKRKKSTINDSRRTDLFHSVKDTLSKMTDMDGRDTERDLYGNLGGYETILSKNTIKNPCPNCSDSIVKEAYLGGAVYYCPVCQPL